VTDDEQPRPETSEQQLAQLRPGQAVAFAFVSPAQAVRAARRQAAILQQIAARLL
jgi:allophanate hydrolase subunit 2